MKTIEELKAEQAAQMESLQREHAIANTCPIPPRYIVMLPGKDHDPWLSYQAKTLIEATDILRAFHVLPVYHFKGNTFAVTMPESIMSTRERRDYVEQGLEKRGPFACWIEVDHASYGTRAELVFYVQLPTGAARVGVRFGADYIGNCHRLKAEAFETRDYRNRLQSRAFRSNIEARTVADHIVSWGTYEQEPIKTSARHSYLFAAEGHEPMPGADCEHALSMLAILGERAGV